MLDLDAVVATTQGLAPLPQSASRMAALLGKPDWELDDVSDTVRLDPALAGRVLSMANSALFGSRFTTTDVGQAVMRIGPGVVLGLAVGLAAKDEMTQSLPAFGLSEGDLWLHSITAALAIEEFRSVCHCTLPPAAFATALLHDIGKLVLGRYLRPSDIELLKRSRSEGGESVTQAELEILEVNHAEIGGLIAEHWKLPEEIIHGITFHHDPTLAPNEDARHLSDLVALADQVAKDLGATDGEFVPDDLDPSIAKRLQATDEVRKEVGKQVEKRLGEVLACYE